MSLGSYTLLGWIHVIIFIQLQSWARTKNKYTKSFWGPSSYGGLCFTLPSTCDTICTACSHQSCPYLWHWQKKRWHFSILYFLCYRYRLQVYCLWKKTRWFKNILLNGYMSMHGICQSRCSPNKANENLRWKTNRLTECITWIW